jgi:hypothetical protein
MKFLIAISKFLTFTYCRKLRKLPPNSSPQFNQVSNVATEICLALNFGVCSLELRFSSNQLSWRALVSEQVRRKADFLLEFPVVIFIGDGQDDDTSIGVISVPVNSEEQSAEVYENSGNRAKPSTGSNTQFGASDVEVIESIDQYMTPGSKNAVGQSNRPVQVVKPSNGQATSTSAEQPLEISDIKQMQYIKQTRPNFPTSNDQATNSGAKQPLEISDINQMQYTPQKRPNFPTSNDQVTYSGAEHPLDISDIDQVQYIPQTHPNFPTSNDQVTYSGAEHPLDISDINQVQYVPQTRHNFATQNGPPIYNVQPATYSQYPSPVRQAYVEAPRPVSPPWGHSAYPEIILDYNPELRFSPGVSSYSSYPSYPAFTGPFNVIGWFKNFLGLRDC